jgi:small-conductance mechanosensitive channel
MVTLENEMWDQVTRSRFETLRHLEEEGVLTEAEQAELERMVAEIEAAEAAYLAPGTERLRAERAQIAAKNAALQELIRRKEELVQRLEKMLDEVKAERRAIDEELERILGSSTASTS